MQIYQAIPSGGCGYAAVWQTAVGDTSKTGQHNSHTSHMVPYISDRIGCVSLKLQLFVCVSEGERSDTSIQPARAYEDESPQCLGPCTDGQDRVDSLLVLVPRRRRKFTTSIQPAKAYEDESVIMSGPH